MKKILTVSLVAMMAVSGARADLASTAYVDTVAAAEASAAQAAAEAKVTELANGAVATNAGNIAKNAQAITEGDNAVKAIIGEVAADKTVVQMINDAQSAATYNDTEVRGLISDNAGAITILNADAQTTGSVENKIAAATANMATDGELESGLATKADKTAFETLQTAVNDQATGLAATYALANAAQTATQVSNAIEAKVTALKLDETYAAKTATETGIQEAKNAASAAQSTANANAGEIASIKTEQGTQNTAIEKNKTDIATINGSAVMTSGITGDLVTQIGTNQTNIATNKADIDAINGGANGIAGMVVSGNPTEGAGKYALTAIVNDSNVITGYKWELISR